MAKSKRKTFKKEMIHQPGEVPGNYQMSISGEKPEIYLHNYHQNGTYETRKVDSYSNLKTWLSEPDMKFWVDIKGLGDVALFDFMKSEFHIHNLVLEDISKTYERPKLEEYSDYLFLVSRMVYFDSDFEVLNKQLSLIQTKNILFSFQHQHQDCLDPVRKRLSLAKGVIRDLDISYLTYAIVDVVIDHYFTILNKWNNELDDLEERIYKNLDREIMNQSQLIRRNIVMLKRAAWGERDKVNDMLRSESNLIFPEVKNYLKDAYDHCIQIMEMIESLKEIASSIMEMYLSMVSNRMNEIMKFLTIMSSLFIPLTFIAGIYGMNFAREDAHSGKIFPWNMPELYSPHGYIYILFVMAIIVVLQIIYFWKKGWFK